jgi:hypothetical protein
VSDELAVIDDAIESLSPERAAAIGEVLEALEGKEVLPERDAFFSDLDTTPEAMQEALDTLLAELEGADIELGAGPGDDDNPAVLDTDQAGRFLELYGRLLVYDGQVVATAPTEDALHQTLSSIMPQDAVDHPYVYLDSARESRPSREGRVFRRLVRTEDRTGRE